jgi:hypothetical protein
MNDFIRVLTLLWPVLEAVAASLLSGAGERAALDAAAEALADLRASAKYKDFISPK